MPRFSFSLSCSLFIPCHPLLPSPYPSLLCPPMFFAHLMALLLAEACYCVCSYLQFSLGGLLPCLFTSPISLSLLSFGKSKVHSFWGDIAFLQHAPKKLSASNMECFPQSSRKIAQIVGDKCREHARSKTP